MDQAEVGDGPTHHLVGALVRVHVVGGPGGAGRPRPLQGGPHMFLHGSYSGLVHMWLDIDPHCAGDIFYCILLNMYMCCVLFKTHLINTALSMQLATSYLVFVKNLLQLSLSCDTDSLTFSTDSSFILNDRQKNREKMQPFNLIFMYCWNWMK